MQCRCCDSSMYLTRMIYHRNIPGVSIMFMCNSSGAGTQAAENLLRNEEPKVESPLNGKSLTPVSAFPWLVCACSPYTTAMNRSVCVCVCVRGGVELDPQAATERSTSPLQYFHRTQLNAFSVHINSVCNSVSCVQKQYTTLLLYIPVVGSGPM